MDKRKKRIAKLDNGTYSFILSEIDIEIGGMVEMYDVDNLDDAELAQADSDPASVINNPKAVKIPLNESHKSKQKQGDLGNGQKDWISRFRPDFRGGSKPDIKPKHSERRNNDRQQPGSNRSIDP